MSSEYNNICHINAIPEQGSKGIRLNKNDFFAVKSEGAVTVYYNSCPHLGSPLQWQSDQFLNYDKSLILCSTHGALFIIESGLCLAGPCQNQSLTMADFYIEDGQLYINDI
ncbi:MAG: nitrite reductase/ring-hydroxylating ferredoxin subunit [Pseudohongiellaceae bacterium]|jgi:nitrite reductase/ring-hydroxylating ferredoxin subunit